MLVILVYTDMNMYYSTSKYIKFYVILFVIVFPYFVLFNLDLVVGVLFYSYDLIFMVYIRMYLLFLSDKSFRLVYVSLESCLDSSKSRTSKKYLHATTLYNSLRHTVFFVIRLGEGVQNNFKYIFRSIFNFFYNFQPFCKILLHLFIHICYFNDYYSIIFLFNLYHTRKFL